MFWNKHLTKLCINSPLHLWYVLALPWEIWSDRLSRQCSTYMDILMNHWIASTTTGSYCRKNHQTCSKYHHLYTTCLKCPPPARIKFTSSSSSSKNICIGFKVRYINLSTHSFIHLSPVHLWYCDPVSCLMSSHVCPSCPAHDLTRHHTQLFQMSMKWNDQSITSKLSESLYFLNVRLATWPPASSLRVCWKFTLQCKLYKRNCVHRSRAVFFSEHVINVWIVEPIAWVNWF